MRTNGRIEVTNYLNEPRYNPETSRYETSVGNKVISPCFVTTVSPQRVNEYFGDIEKQVINVNVLRHLDIDNKTTLKVNCPDLNIKTDNCKVLRTSILRNGKQVVYLEVIK